MILLIGSIWGSFSGYTAQQIIPRGEVFHLAPCDCDVRETTLFFLAL